MMAVDPKWEFDCPQYVDFNEPLQCDEAVDSFFDSHLEVCEDHANASPTGNNINTSKCMSKIINKKDKQTLDKKRTNTYLQAVGDSLRKLYSLRVTPSRLAREVTDSPKSKKIRLSDKMDTKPSNLDKKYDVRNEEYASNVDCSSNQKSYGISSLQLSRQQKNLISKKGSAASFKAKLRCQKSRHVRKRMAEFSKKFIIKSSEEIEMDKIKELREELAAHRTLSKQSMKKALLNPNISQNNSTASQKQHTITKPFKFATESRIKNNVEVENRREKDFVSSLRSSQQVNQQSCSVGKVTKPVPFMLSTNRKRKFDEVKESYCSLAEQVEAFQHGKTFANANKNVKDFQCSLTMPKTPNLRAVSRHRPVTALSQEEKEELLIQEMKSYKFKANDINAGIIDKPRALKPVKRKSATRPEDVHLETERRYMLRERVRPKHEQEQFEFHANPAPKKILEQIVGLKQKVELPCTDPQSPAFALKQRAQAWKDKNVKQKCTETPIPKFRAQPLPHTGVPFWPKFQKKSTVTEPFSFEEQDNERKARKEKKIQEEIEKQSKRPEFKARPILTPSKSDLPIVPKMPLTQVQPFNLLADQRGSEKLKKWNKQIEEEFMKQKKLAVFKAGENKVIYDKPFVPTCSAKPPSDIMDIKLHTELRAEERENFESWRLSRQKELEEEYKRQQKEQKEKEDAEIARLRIETVHKAMPVKHYRSKPIQPTNIELTQPHSPFLYTRLRCKERYNQQSKIC